MATTAILPIHASGRAIAKSLKMSVGYIENPDKTDCGEWVTSYECDPLIADAVSCKGCFRIAPLLQQVAMSSVAV